MKKVLLLLVVVLIATMFTGCVEVIHLVSIKDGVVSTSVRYTVQKVLFDMLAAFSGEAIDYSEINDIGEQAFSNIPEAVATIKPINTQYDFGAEIFISGHPDALHSISDETIIFVPEKVEHRYIITIPMMGEDGVDEDEAEFLAGSKYRLIVSLTDDLKHIGDANVYIADSKTDRYEYELEEADGLSITVQDAIMLVEIPMMMLFAGEEAIVVELT